MLAHHAMPKFECRSNCQHKECQRHAPLGLINQQREECKCVGETDASSIFLENVLDMSNTLSQIMILCGIHECKAKAAIDVITYAFLHYDQVCYGNDNIAKKRIRKEDLFHELGRRTLMNRVEAQLAYTIVKRGFKAFYYKPKVSPSRNPDGPGEFNEECVYVHAAKKTADSYGSFDGLSCDEQRGYEAKIKVLYKKFYDRMQLRKTKPVGDDCNCCFCAKNRNTHVYAKSPPCSSKKKEPHKCPHCCQKKVRKTFIHSGRTMAKCPVCHRSRKFCTCEKYKFSLDWVKSIWERPDFDLYYKEYIDDERTEKRAGTQCTPTNEDKAGPSTQMDPIPSTEKQLSTASHLTTDNRSLAAGRAMTDNRPSASASARATTDNRTSASTRATTDNRQSGVSRANKIPGAESTRSRSHISISPNVQHAPE